MPIIGATVVGIIVLVLVSSSMMHPGGPPSTAPVTQPPSTAPPPAANGYSFIKKWGSIGTADGQFNNPIGVAVDSSGNVYVADSRNQRIQKFSSDGSFITKWGSNGTADGQFNRPLSVAVVSYRIQVFSPS